MNNHLKEKYGDDEPDIWRPKMAAKKRSFWDRNESYIFPAIMLGIMVAVMSFAVYMENYHGKWTPKKEVYYQIIDANPFEYEEYNHISVTEIRGDHVAFEYKDVDGKGQSASCSMRLFREKFEKYKR